MNALNPVQSLTLRQFQPIGSLSETRLQELAALCYVERVSKHLDPFRIQSLTGKTVYLLRGELALTQADGGAIVLVGGSEEARLPVGRRSGIAAAKAITDLELIRIDDELIDIMMTWDQLAEVEQDHASAVPSGRPADAPAADRGTARRGDWRLLTGLFSMNNLRYGAFSKLPSAHIAELLTRFTRHPARRGEAVVREGEEGDFYYVIEQGRCQVTRKVGGVDMKLAQLKAGDAFGEEALLSDGKRNASVVMLADGSLLRLAKSDFIELLQRPLLKEVDLADARGKAARGGQWIDVRYPSEFQFDKIPGALNIPLAEIRNAAGILDRSRDYIVYCQSGRRSSAAAFLLAQRGYNAYVLRGGLAAYAESRTA
jgi:rhodanese-related sulfurtransferase